MPIHGLTAYAHVGDVACSMEFYALLGLEEVNRYEPDGRLSWALMERGEARIMLALASAPVVAAQQAVLFYCWADDVAALRAELLASGHDVGEVTHPHYMPAGEIRVEDPDGYVVLIGQLSR